jgi:hypothetical protein
LTLLARCDDINEKQQIAIFIAGMPPQMGIDVELQKPTSLDDAMSLARAYECHHQLVNNTPRPAPCPTGPPLCAPLSSTQGSKSFAAPAPWALHQQRLVCRSSHRRLEPASLSCRLRRWRSGTLTACSTTVQRSFPANTSSSAP